MSTKNNDPRAALAAVSEEAKHLFCSVRALQQLVESIEGPLVTQAQNALPMGTGDSTSSATWQPTNYIHHFGPISIDKRLPLAKAVLAVLEASPEFQEAEKLITPIQKDIAALEVREAAARDEHARARGSYADAVAVAEEKALAVVAKDPKVVEATRALNEAARALTPTER